MTKIGDVVFIDSNVLVSFLDTVHPFRPRTLTAYRQWRTHGNLFAISPQVVGETFKTLTSSHYATGPANSAAVQALIGQVLSNSSILVYTPGRTAIDYALQTAVKLNLTSSRIFDLLLYGTMLEHGIKKLATFNVKHFTGLTDIEIVPIP